MDIVWFGESCFRLARPSVSVVTDPYWASSPALPNLTADIVTLSGGRITSLALRPLDGNPRFIERPGEYEIKGAVITGVATPRRAVGESKSGVRQRNCVFLIELDGIVICHLGYLDHVPSTQQVEELSGVDVLLVPVGGHETLNAADAVEVISMVEPRIVVPMLHDAVAAAAVARTSAAVGRRGDEPPRAQSDGEALERFCRELGVQDTVPQVRLSITRSHLPGDTQVVVLQSQMSDG